MSKPLVHLDRLRKHVRRMEEEIHRMHDHGRIRDAAEYIRMSDLSAHVDSVRQAIEEHQSMNGKG